MKGRILGTRSTTNMKKSPNARNQPRRSDKIHVSDPDHPIQVRPRARTRLLDFPKAKIIEPNSNSHRNQPNSRTGLPDNWNETSAAVKSKADSGDPAAQLIYANILFNGRGIPVDRAGARKYFKKSADGGNCDAQYQFADILMSGWGMPKNPKLACEYFTKASSQGHLESKYRLGMTYLVGDGIPQDLKQAETLFKDGAENGHSNCQFEYAKILEGKEEFEEAEKFYKLAADQGNAQASQSYVKMLKKRESRGGK